MTLKCWWGTKKTGVLYYRGATINVWVLRMESFFNWILRMNEFSTYSRYLNRYCFQADYMDAILTAVHLVDSKKKSLISWRHVKIKWLYERYTKIPIIRVKIYSTLWEPRHTSGRHGNPCWPVELLQSKSCSGQLHWRPSLGSTLVWI